MDTSGKRRKIAKVKRKDMQKEQIWRTIAKVKDGKDADNEQT